MLLSRNQVMVYSSNVWYLKPSAPSCSALVRKSSGRLGGHRAERVNNKGTGIGKTTEMGAKRL